MPIGYSIIGPRIAWMVETENLIERILTPLARGTLYEELRLAGRVRKFRLAAWCAHGGFHAFTSSLGWVANLFFGRIAETKDQRMVKFLKDNNLYFER